MRNGRLHLITTKSRDSLIPFASPADCARSEFRKRFYGLVPDLWQRHEILTLKKPAHPAFGISSMHSSLSTRCSFRYRDSEHGFRYTASIFQQARITLRLERKPLRRSQRQDALESIWSSPPDKVHAARRLDPEQFRQTNRRSTIRDPGTTHSWSCSTTEHFVSSTLGR